MGRAKVHAFLEKRELLAADVDMEKELERFLEHMRKGLAGVPLPDAMPMIPTYLALGRRVPVDEPVIVMDAGGTNFRICLVTFDRKMTPKVEHFKKFPMPGTDREISGSEFYHTIADAVLPYLKYSKTIGFCFSYACEIQPDKDGRILNFSKEVRCPEAVDTLVGASLKKVLREEKGVEDEVHVVLLNDTVAALLGGYAQTNTREFDGNAGFILGTGTNCAYLEDNQNITKLRGKINPFSNMIINMESGDYRIASLSPIDREIDALTNAPGTYSFEKLISGRYQGLQALYTIREAIECTDLFSGFFAENFAMVNELESYQLDDFLYAPYGPGVLSQCCANDIDREHLFFIIDNIFERAAKLVAMSFCALHIQTDTGRNPTRPLAITVDGSTFYKSKLFRSKLKYWVKDFINDKYGFYNEFLKVENANLIGAAIAGLTN